MGAPTRSCTGVFRCNVRGRRYRERMATDVAKVEEDVQKLVSLAVDAPEDDEGRTNEARNAALQAVKMMHDNGLILVRADRVSTLENRLKRANAEIVRLQKDGTSKVVLGGAIGLGLAKFLKL